MPDYRFIIEDASGQFSGGGCIKTSPESCIPSGNTGTTDSRGGNNGFAAGLSHRVGQTVTQQLLSPINSATGGLASPMFGLGKAIVGGAGAAAVGAGIAGIAITAVMLVVNKLQERMAKLENEAIEANNRDNVLIRAGVVKTPTMYSSNMLGVKKDTRRN